MERLIVDMGLAARVFVGAKPTHTGNPVQFNTFSRILRPSCGWFAPDLSVKTRKTRHRIDLLGGREAGQDRHDPTAHVGIQGSSFSMAYRRFLIFARRIGRIRQAERISAGHKITWGSCRHRKTSGVRVQGERLRAWLASVVGGQGWACRWVTPAGRSGQRSGRQQARCGHHPPLWRWGLCSRTSRARQGFGESGVHGGGSWRGRGRPRLPPRCRSQLPGAHATTRSAETFSATTGKGAARRPSR